MTSLVQRVRKKFTAPMLEINVAPLATPAQKTKPANSGLPMRISSSPTDFPPKRNDDSNQGDVPLVQRVRRKPAAGMLEINVAPLATPARKTKPATNDDSNQGDVPLVQRVRRKPATPMLEINAAPLTTPAKKAKPATNDDSNQGDVPLVQRVRRKPATPMLEINVAPLTTPTRKAKPANLSDKSLASLKKQSALPTQAKKPVLRATAKRKSVDTKAKNGAATHAMAKRTRPAGEKQAQIPTVPTASQMLQRQKLPMAKVQEMMRERDPTYMIETNALTIIEFSYVCPFKCRHNHLLCHYCGAHFIDPVHLREHTETSHSPKKFKIAEHRNMLKVDLTRIDCRLCPENITNLDDFKKHISSVHNKKYYFDFKDLILPFKLTKNEMKCAVCDVIFPYFHALNKHMNVHFSNYVCETCGLGFVDKGRFVMHQQRHEEGDYPCETCGKVFKAQYNRDLHNDRVHMKRGRVYCPKCDIRLMSYHQKLKHLVEVHGEEPLSFTCNVCDKVFETRRTLTIHRRKDHLKDYRYICQCCGQKFFTRFALNNHMPVHTGARDFKCKVCEKTYPRLKTLKDHIRIHTNDRRYRCHICGQAFIQNCSLKGHMKSQHPEYG
ncbi:zinc finger protein ZFP2-like [Ostrinia nubilalis]|uniref:zinc finger protein ZFP2-like n=1 Tax=Ostrinia nubilalis TaxID=29057 RepID=UPI0030825475